MPLYLNLSNVHRSGYLTFHIFIVLSYEPEARVCPSGENATLYTSPLCPVRVRITDPSDTLHSFIVLSPEPEARVCPSGENATLYTSPLCPVRVRITDPSD